VGRLVDFPILLRRKTNARPVRAAALVGATERGRRCPGGRDQLGDRQARGKNLALEVCDVLFVDKLMIDCGHRVLPDQFLLRDLRTEIARAGAHVAVRQLEPRPGEGVRELLRVLVEPLRNRCIDWIHPQREVRRGHHGRVPFRRIMSIRHSVRCGWIGRNPLVRTGRAFHQIPIVAEQSIKIAIIPLDRGRVPCSFDATADRVAAFASAKTALPAEALFLDAGGLGFRADKRRIARAMTLAERVAAGNQRDGLLVVHRHARKGLADVAARSDHIRFAVRPFRVHVDQAHLHGGKRIFKVPVAGVALVAKPLALGPPVNVLFRFPDVLAPAAEAEGLEAHRLQSAVAGEDHQVGPGESCCRISA